MYWVDIQLAQRKGLKFCQTRCNAIILYDTLPAYCISKVVAMKSEEIIHQKVYVSPRPPPKTSYKDNWMNELDSEVAGSSKDTQRIQPKPKNQLPSTGGPVCGQESTKEIEKRTVFDHEDVKHSTRKGRPVCGSKSTHGCVLMPTKIEEDQTRTERPIKVEEHDIDFRVPGLSHAVVKEAEHLRVQELVKKIENHPHREALHADLQQNNVYNLFCKNPKAMIRELGNVELFELYNVLTVFFLGILESRNSAELETVTTSRSPTTVITANGEVQTHEEATVYVKEFDIFLTNKVLDHTPAVLSLGKLCDEHGYSYKWINGQKPHLMTENFVPIVVLGLSTSSSPSLPSSTPMTPSRQEIDHPKSSSSSST